MLRVVLIETFRFDFPPLRKAPKRWR